MIMQIEDYEVLDLVRVTNKMRTVVGIIHRKYISGGNPGMRVVGVNLRDMTQADIHVFNPREVELLWREDKEAE